MTPKKTETVGKQSEHNLQKSCVQVFRLKYPHLAPDLFSIPNGGNRNVITATRLKAEGCTRGVPDLFLSVPKGGYGGLFIEMKAAKGSLTPEQKAFFERNAYRYRCVVCKSLDEFLKEIKDYLK